MVTINAGDLTHLIDLEVATAGQDAATGEQVLTWAREATVWAAWRPATARELSAAQGARLGAYIDGTFVIYDYLPRPSPERYRIREADGRLFDLRGVRDLPRGAGLELDVIAHGETP